MAGTLTNDYDEPTGLQMTDTQKEAKRYFSKTEEYLEGENMLLQKLHHMWPLVEACFARERGLAEPRQPIVTENAHKPASRKALVALGEIQQNLAIAEGRQAATGL